MIFVASVLPAERERAAARGGGSGAALVALSLPPSLPPSPPLSPAPSLLLLLLAPPSLQAGSPLLSPTLPCLPPSLVRRLTCSRLAGDEHRLRRRRAGLERGDEAPVRGVGDGVQVGRQLREGVVRCRVLLDPFVRVERQPLERVDAHANLAAERVWQVPVEAGAERVEDRLLVQPNQIDEVIEQWLVVHNVCVYVLAAQLGQGCSATLAERLSRQGRAGPCFLRALRVRRPLRQGR